MNAVARETYLFGSGHALGPGKVDEMKLCSAYAASAVVAAIGLASPVRAEPFDPNEPANADFLATVRAAGVPGEPHGLISGAQNTVCPELDQGNPYQDIAGMLEKYSHFTRRMFTSAKLPVITAFGIW